MLVRQRKPDRRANNGDRRLKAQGSGASSMLRKEQNDLLTQTGPGTPMGRMFRAYWLPALLAEELPEPECPPVRVKLMSERLLAWRDTQGRLALTDEFCAHRGVSLWFGRNEEDGLRCPYHGWKYDHTGQCIDVPVRAAGKRLLPEDQAEVLSAGRARRRAVDLHGSARGAAAAAGVGIRHGAGGPQLHVQARSRSATGCRRWRAASIPATSRSCIAASSTRIRCSRAPRATSTTWATRGRCSRSSRAPAASTSAPAATPRTATITGASRNG